MFHVEHPKVGVSGSMVRMPGDARSFFASMLSSSPTLAEQLKAYARLLRVKGVARGVVGPGEADQIVERHIIDSLLCLPLLPAPPLSIVDVGSGAGLPGIPVSLAVPGAAVVLLESQGRRCAFLEEAITRAGGAASVTCARAEDYGKGAGRDSFDVALSRALASAPVVLEYCLPLVAVGGRIIAIRGEPGPDEREATSAAARLLGGSSPRWERPSAEWLGLLGELLPGSRLALVRDSYLLVVEKASPTDARFPRRAGIPMKRPLGTSHPPLR
jgi:16S rRNA (guanine527-N7)-methyltransferase